MKPSGEPVGADVQKQYIYSLLKAIGRNKGASIPCTLMVYVSVKVLALTRNGEDTLM